MPLSLCRGQAYDGAAMMQGSTVPITSSTSERSFSTLRRVLSYLRSTMSEERLNNCMLLHIHKDITDKLNLQEVARDFVSLHEERKRHFGTF